MNCGHRRTNPQAQYDFEAWLLPYWKDICAFQVKREFSRRKCWPRIARIKSITWARSAAKILRMKRILLPAVLLCLFLQAVQARQSERLRLIVVSTEAVANSVRAQIQSGASFESLNGFLGTFAIRDLRPELQAAAAGLKEGEISAVVRFGGDFALLQRVPEGKRTDPVEGQPVESRWGSIEVLDSFAALLSRAYFRDREFDEALKKYEQAVSGTPLSEDLYLAMNNILSNAELRTEAEALMVRALAVYPDSRRVRYRLAELHRDSGRMKKALEVFKEASQLKAPEGMDARLDRRQRSFIYQRIGGINTDLVQFDDALAAYRTALEIDPTNGEARGALGDLYLKRDRLDEALTEYQRVVTEYPSSAAAHSRLAELFLRMGRFAEAVDAATKAVDLDPAHRRSSYVRAMALIRSGRVEEGQKQLAVYERLETEAQNEANRARTISVVSRGAAAQLMNGQAADAIETFREGLKSHPEAFSIHLNLAMTHVKLGRHADATKALAAILDLGYSDNFLVHFNLAREYELQGDTKLAEQHRLQYVESINAALERGLN